MSIFDWIPAGEVREVLKKIGLSGEIKFELDQLFTGGFQASLILEIGLTKWELASPQLRAGLDLVDLFGIDSVDCESSDLKGKKCFVVGIKESGDCFIKESGSSASASEGTRRARPTATTLAALTTVSTFMAVQR